MGIPAEVLSRVMLGRFNDAEKAVIWRALIIYYSERDGRIDLVELEKMSEVNRARLKVAVESLVERGILIDRRDDGGVQLGEFLLESLPREAPIADPHRDLSDWGRSTHPYV